MPTNMTEQQFSEMVQGYLDCAAWADGYFEAPNTSLRFPRSSRERARRDCQAFVGICLGLIDQALAQPGYTPTRLGHDFWLSRCGHGAGFWDRDELDVTAALRIACQDRRGRHYITGQADSLGNALHAAAYGDASHISVFAYASLYVSRGWMYFA